jgi:RNA polymerase sigma-70 factor, ECF subfamily
LDKANATVSLHQRKAMKVTNFGRIDAYLRGQRPRLTGYLRMMLGGSADVDDVTQEVFLRYFRQGPEPGTPQADAWLFAASRNRALNLLRDGARRQKRELEYAQSVEPAGRDPLNPDEQADALRRIEDCMQKLPAALREMLYLKIVGGLTVREVADRISVPKSTVALRTSEALVLLTRCFHRRV